MTLTSLVMLSATILLIVFDVYIIIKKGKRESISSYIINGSKKYPLIVFAAGILTGHLLWSMSSFDYLPKDKLIEKCKAVINER